MAKDKHAYCGLTLQRQSKGRVEQIRKGTKDGEKRSKREEEKVDEVTNETNEKKALDVKEAPRNHYVSSQSMLKTEQPLKEEGQRCMVI